VIACPLLKPGEHYDIGTRWAVILRAMVSTPLPLRAEPHDFLSGQQVLARWDGREFHVMPGYACDGYSPVIRICGRWVRLTPTPPCGLWPAVLHDVLRQFLSVPGCPWSRAESDAWFYEALHSGGLHPHHAGIYHGAVAGPLGSAWLRLTRTRDLRLRITPAEASPRLRQATAG
jgi:hypothetical protein